MSVNNETLPGNGSLSPSALILVLDEIKTKFIYQLPLIITILGFVGFIGNAFTFLQPALRRNSFCIYTLCGSLVDVINIFTNLFPNFLNPLNGNLVSAISDSFLCKLKVFALVFLPQLSINLLIMSLIDRYVCTSPLTSPMRRLLKLKTVPWLIGTTVIISCLMSLYAPILNDVIPGFGCGSTNPMLNGILYIFIHGILTPGSILAVVLLTYRRFKQSPQRVGVTRVGGINHFRNQFILLVFAQAFATSFFGLPWIATYWYFIATLYESKSNEEWAITYFVLSLTNNFYYLINAKSFYLSTLASRLFRTTFMTAFRKLLPRDFHRG